MPYGKFSYSRKKKAYAGRRRRRPYRRSMGRSRFGSKAHLRVKLNGGNFSIRQRNDDQFYSESMKLFDLANYDKYCKVFDKYKIVKINMNFRPMYRANSIAFDGAVDGGNRILTPLLYTAVDTTDNRLITEIEQIRGYNNCRVASDDKTHRVTWTPKFLEYVFDGNSDHPLEAGSKSGWLACINPNIPHYGIKMAITGFNNEDIDPEALGQEWNVDWNATVLFKDCCQYSTAEEAVIDSYKGDQNPDDNEKGPPGQPATTTVAPTTAPPTTTPP